MRILTKDLWHYHGKGNCWVVITTNTECRRDGTAVMGRGIALQAAQKFPPLPRLYGTHLQARKINDEPVWYGLVGDYPWNLICFPTKHAWRENSLLDLIEQNLVLLVQEWTRRGSKDYVALPPLGCGNGGLNWETQVKPLCEQYLTDPHFGVVPPTQTALFEVPRVEPVLFWSGAKDRLGRVLSNFYICPVHCPCHGISFGSSEQAYFYHLAGTDAGREAILQANTPQLAKSLAKLHPQDDWRGRHVPVMEACLEWKFTDPGLRTLLLGTGNRPLIHYAPWGDTYWGVDKSMQGGNLQGKLLMQLREKLKEEG